MIGLTISLLLPLALGVIWLRKYWKDSHWAAVIGYGYLLGMFFTTLLIQIWDAAGLPLNFDRLYITLTILLAIGLWANRSTNTSLLSSSDGINTNQCKLRGWQQLLWFSLYTILIIRYAGIFLEIAWRPLYPWDAWTNWVPKAKTWFELKELAPFVSSSDWAANSIHHDVYTLGNSSASTYPPVVPLIQTWTALGIGTWIDNLANLPWVLCVMVLGFAFYGQANNLNISPLSSMLTVYILLSLP